MVSHCATPAVLVRVSPPLLWPLPSFVCSMMSSMMQIPTLLSSTLLLAVSRVPTWGMSPSIKGIAASPNCSSTAPKQLCTWSSKSSSNSFSPCNPEEQSLRWHCVSQAQCNGPDARQHCSISSLLLDEEARSGLWSGA